MAVPTQSEIDKKRKDYESNLKKLDENGSISEKLALNNLRSAVRKEWMRSPVKLAVLYEAMVPDTSPHTRTKWLYRCAICNCLFKLTDVEVDHVDGEHGLTSIDMFNDFWNNVLRVPKSGLQVLCVEDHLIKTYAERYNLSWEDAVKKKAVIKKLTQTVENQKKELKLFGYSGKMVSNENNREKCYLELLIAGKI